MVGYEVAVDAANKDIKTGPYQTFSPSEKYHTGKYVLKNGTTSTLRKFKNKSPSAKESTG